MARPIKDGVDYFPKDTDFYSDDKVRLLRAEFGAKGMYILDYLLCEIYRTNGYFIKWDKNRCFLVSDGAGCGCSPDFIEEVVAGCVRCLFFDERVFNLFGVLTSPGIQRRYIRMFNSRDEIQVESEYWLLDVNSKKDVPAGVLNKLAFKTDKSTGNPDKSTGNPDKTTENPQSKTEQNKTKQSRTKHISVPAEIESEWNAYVKMRKEIKKPLTDDAAKLAMDKLEKLSGGDVELERAILNQSVFNSWQGLYEIKDGDSNERKNKRFKPSRT